MVADAQKRGLDWGAMRANAHKAAEGLGMDLAAVIVNANTSTDGEVAKILTRAQEMRDEYAAFTEIWYADACAKDAALPLRAREICVEFNGYYSVVVSATRTMCWNVVCGNERLKTNHRSENDAWIAAAKHSGAVL